MLFDKPWHAFPTRNDEDDGRWRLKYHSADNIRASDEFSCPTILEHRIWYAFYKIILKQARTYTTMFCFSPNGHEKVEHGSHLYILQIN